MSIKDYKKKNNNASVSTSHIYNPILLIYSKTLTHIESVYTFLSLLIYTVGGAVI